MVFSREGITIPTPLLAPQDDDTQTIQRGEQGESRVRKTKSLGRMDPTVHRLPTTD